MEWLGKNNLAIGFIRRSTKKQEDNLSGGIQVDAITEHCERHGLELVRLEHLIESAKDSDNRKKYDDARARALKEGIRHHVYYMGDRETRNLTDNERNEKDIRNGKIVIHYARDNRIMHKGSPDSDFLSRDMNALVAKQFSRNLSAKVGDAMRAKAEQGWYPGNHPPLGYMNQYLTNASGHKVKRGTIIVPDSNELAVRQIIREFELRAEGWSFEAIRQQIVREGFIKPSKVKEYRANTVHKHLTSRFYWGYFQWQKIEYQGKHELIIPQRLLDAVATSSGQCGNRITYGSKQVAIFGSGWLRCAHPECGCKIIYDPRKGTARPHHYYHCTNGKKVHQSMKGMNVREEHIWEQFGKAVESITINQTLAEQIMEALNETHQKVRAAKKREIAEFRAALKELEAKEDDLYSDQRNHKIEESQYKRMIAKVRADRDYYTKLLEQANEALDGVYLETAESVLKLATDAKSLWNNRNPQEKRDFLDKILSNPQLDGPTVRYEMKKPFSILSKMASSDKWRSLGDSNPRYLREREVS